MEKFRIAVFLILCTNLVLLAQNTGISFTSQHLSENQDLSDILFFEGIDFYKLQFTGQELTGKTFKLTAKEMWDGNLRKETLITDSSQIDVKGLETIKDSIFRMKIISKAIDDKLRMSFKFPRYGRDIEFDAIQTRDYSLRNIAETFKEEFEIGKPFFVLAYILPYEKDGAKYWCAVESSGKDIENWGKKFGIKHYIIFEMCFGCNQ